MGVQLGVVHLVAEYVGVRVREQRVVRFRFRAVRVNSQPYVRVVRVLLVQQMVVVDQGAFDPFHFAADGDEQEDTKIGHCDGAVDDQHTVRPDVQVNQVQRQEPQEDNPQVHPVRRRDLRHLDQQVVQLVRDVLVKVKVAREPVLRVRVGEVFVAGIDEALPQGGVPQAFVRVTQLSPNREPSVPQSGFPVLLVYCQGLVLHLQQRGGQADVFQKPPPLGLLRADFHEQHDGA